MILTARINDTDLSVNDLKRYRRKKKILQSLYFDGLLNSSQLSFRLSVSIPTIISLLNELIDEKLVINCGEGISKGGRRPALFGLKEDSVFVVVCELGRFNGKINVFNEHNRPICSPKYFKSSIDDDNLAEFIFRLTDDLITENNINRSEIYGIGVSMPGLVDETKGINYTIKQKSLQNIKKRLVEKFDKFIYVNNDARMQAYGEFVFGKAKGSSDALIIGWNRGLGLGMILDGKLYNGASGFAGELSHIRYIEKGDLCICGKRGCLETVASVGVLLEKARQAIKEGTISQLTRKFEDRLEELDVKDVLLAAKQGDEFSISLLNELGLALGKALSNTIQLLNPEIIVLGGILSEANQYVLNPIEQSINKYCLEQISRKTQIVISDNWEQSGLQGLTAMLFKKLYSDMYLDVL